MRGFVPTVIVVASILVVSSEALASGCCGGGGGGGPPVSMPMPMPSPTYTPTVPLPPVAASHSGSQNKGSTATNRGLRLQAMSPGRSSAFMPPLPIIGIIPHPRVVFNFDHVSSVVGFGASVSGDHMAFFLSDGTVSLWSLQLGREVLRRTGNNAATAVAAASQASVVASAGTGGVELWNLTGYNRERSFTTSEATTVAVADDGKMVAGGLADGAVVVWAASGGEQQRLAGGGPAVTALAFAANKPLVAVGDTDGRVRLWDLRTGAATPIPVASAAIERVQFLPGSSTLLVSDRDGGVRVMAGGAAVHDLPMGRGGKAKSITVSEDGRTLAVARDDGSISLLDPSSGAIKGDIKGDVEVQAIRFLKGDKLLFALLGDGTVWVVGLPAGTEIARLVMAPKGWVAVTANGNFDGEAEGIDATSLIAANGNLNIPLEQFTQSNFEPGLLAKLIEGKMPTAAATASHSIGVPPLAVFAPGLDGTSVDSATATAQLTVTDQGGGIHEIRIYQNGKLIKRQNAQPGAHTVPVTVNVALTEGENKLSAVALSNDNIEGRPVELTIRRTGVQPTGRILVMTVGINQYPHPSLNLEYGVADSDGIAGYFNTAVKPVFTSVVPAALRDLQATRQAILSGFDRLAEGNPEDTVVVYLAGHGETINNKWYFIPTDVSYPVRRETLPSSSVSIDEITTALARIKAQKVVLLLDSCKSGAALSDIRNFEARKEWTLMARLAGVHVIAAAGKDQYAVELPELGHGAFTYALLTGLEGKAAVGSSGPKISVVNLEDYVRGALPELSSRYAGEPQLPVVYSRGGDFTVGAKTK